MPLHCVCVQVHGIIRRASTFNTHRIQHLYANPMSHAEGGLWHAHLTVEVTNVCVHTYMLHT